MRAAQDTVANPTIDGAGNDGTPSPDLQTTQWVIAHTSLFKRLIMHIKEMCRLVTLEFDVGRERFILQAFAAFNQTFLQVDIPPTFFIHVQQQPPTMTPVARRLMLDATHLHRALLSCARTDRILVAVTVGNRYERSPQLRVIIVRHLRHHIITIPCRMTDRQCASLPLDHMASATASCNMLHTAMMRLDGIVRAVRFELRTRSHRDTMHLFGANDCVDAHVQLPVQIQFLDVVERDDDHDDGEVADDSDHPPHSVTTHKNFDLAALLTMVHFSTISHTGMVQMALSPGMPLKLIFPLLGEGRILMLIA